MVARPPRREACAARACAPASACTSQVSPAAHREMIKHLPKMARRHYATAAAEGGSKWRAGASTSLAVLRRPSMAEKLTRSDLARPPPAPPPTAPPPPAPRPTATPGAPPRPGRPASHVLGWVGGGVGGGTGESALAARVAAQTEVAVAASWGASARSRRARRLRPTPSPHALAPRSPASRRSLSLTLTRAGAPPSTCCARAAPWLPTWPSIACAWPTAA